MTTSPPGNPIDVDPVPIDPIQEAGYNVRRLRPNFTDIIEGWARQSQAYRDRAKMRSHAYGPGERDRLDLFSCGSPGAPLLVFLHGGYWQSGDRSIYSFLADAFTKSGVDMALVGYPLCPDVTLSHIVETTQRAMIWLWKYADEVGVCRDRINLCGHSAGGHLTGAGIATAWPSLAPGLPDDLIKTAIPISGVFQVEPLRYTTIGAALHLSEAEANRVSPLFQDPKGDPKCLVIVGEAETDLFHWQSDQLVERWGPKLTTIERFNAPKADHFDIIDHLGDADSALFKRLRGWLD
ncbi:MAG: alpha/beta hydrolase [Pseudomonadota bacterium]